MNNEATTIATITAALDEGMDLPASEVAPIGDADAEGDEAALAGSPEEMGEAVGEAGALEDDEVEFDALSWSMSPGTVIAELGFNEPELVRRFLFAAMAKRVYITFVAKLMYVEGSMPDMSIVAPQFMASGTSLVMFMV